MNNKDAHVHKVLAELGLKDEPQLTPEQEDMIELALDPTEQELADMLRVLTNNNK